MWRESDDFFLFFLYIYTKKTEYRDQGKQPKIAKNRKEESKQQRLQLKSECSTKCTRLFGK